MPTRIVPRTIRFSDEDYACLERAALLKGYSNTSTWIRELAKAAAARILSGDDVGAEHQYDRMAYRRCWKAPRCSPTSPVIRVKKTS
jgi:hypothetical protein